MGRGAAAAIVASLLVCGVALQDGVGLEGQRGMAAAGADDCAKQRPWLTPGLSAGQQVALLMSCMSLKEKIGQMLVTSSRTVDDGEITALRQGAYFYGGTTGFDYKDGNWPKKWLRKSAKKQKEAVCGTRLGIPLIIATDRTALIQSATAFLHNIGVGAICAGKAGEALKGCAEIAREIGEAVAKDARAQLYQPTICVSTDVRWGRTYECFGSSAELVSALSVMIEGIQSAGLAATAKHYVGDGSAQWGTSDVVPGKVGIDRGNALAATLNKPLTPYVAAINEHGAMSVMTSYSSVGSVKMHENGYLLSNVLRKACPLPPILENWFTPTRATCSMKETVDMSVAIGKVQDLAFCGYVTTDYDAIADDRGTPRQQMRNAIVAGNDMLMVPKPDQAAATLATVTKLVCRDGAAAERCDSACIPAARINEAVHNILMTKAQLGLLQAPWPLEAATCGFPAKIYDVERVGTSDNEQNKETKKLAILAAEKSQVLLKNVEGTLPLDKDRVKTVLLLGTAANNVGRQCGGWTINWQGDQAFRQDGTTVKGALQGMGLNIVTKVKDAVRAARADGASSVVALVVASEPPYTEFKGDELSPTLPKKDKGAIKFACKSAFPWRCVVVVAAGRPLDIPQVLANTAVDAFVHTWLPGSEGGHAIVNKLFALEQSESRTWDYEGRMPVPWPVTISDGPGLPHLFEYSYGCSTLETSSSGGIDCDVSNLAVANTKRRRALL
ncbi:glycoside hydrolase superfamily [Tribonema minus]|uniref:beta-glucosidase n=1 Tax=Tribonema minus TaxID=303371 RepID=A0A835YIX5_9STRA|nr:glycoside hydrolase superfamily [Tribonema minus]